MSLIVAKTEALHIFSFTQHRITSHVWNPVIDTNEGCERNWSVSYEIEVDDSRFSVMKAPCSSRLGRYCLILLMMLPSKSFHFYSRGRGVVV